MARQGIRYTVLEYLDVLDPATLQPVPRDGVTMGEVMFRGNVVMKGYLKDPEATDKALAGGWFHSGDLAVKHPDGWIQLKDRSKDIIISGGENISSIEVEEALYRHPAVAMAAVVAMADEKWGERPCAFVELKPGATATEEELIAFCRQHSGGLQDPSAGGVPRTAAHLHRQDPEACAARQPEKRLRRFRRGGGSATRRRPWTRFRFPFCSSPSASPLPSRGPTLRCRMRCRKGCRFI